MTSPPIGKEIPVGKNISTSLSGRLPKSGDSKSEKKIDSENPKVDSARILSLRKTLRQEAERLKPLPIAGLFQTEPERSSALTLSLKSLYADFSKQKISLKALKSLIKYAETVKLKEALKAMISGAEINTSEKRKVLHMALRGTIPEARSTQNLHQTVRSAREQCRKFANAVRSGAYKGITGKPVRHLLHIGIGGSDLGPRLIAEALSPEQTSEIQLSFVANIDPEEIEAVLSRINPEETLVFLVSKSFSTLEVQANAQRVLSWYRACFAKKSQKKPDARQERKEEALPYPVNQTQTANFSESGTPEQIMAHFIAVTACPEKARAFGIPEQQIFQLQDGVGGRYSLWSSVSLSLEILLGSSVFERLLAGAHEMDQHFLSAEYTHNAPILLALSDFWSRQFLGYETRTILPYRHRLRLFPAYLQQLEMESNGKSINKKGQKIEASCPIVWGGEGTNAQHAFFQLLHQGTSISPVHFIAVSKGKGESQAERALLANCLAQGEALMMGRSREETLKLLEQEGNSKQEIEELLPQKTFAGDRPSITLLLEELTAFTLGQLIALYEHKVFTEGVLLGINSFDQWGVELGKGLAGQIEKELNTGTPGQHDPSTTGLMKEVLKNQRKNPPEA